MRAVTAVCENGNAVASLRENGDELYDKFSAVRPEYLVQRWGWVGGILAPPPHVKKIGYSTSDHWKKKKKKKKTPPKKKHTTNKPTKEKNNNNTLLLKKVGYDRPMLPRVVYRNGPRTIGAGSGGGGAGGRRPPPPPNQKSGGGGGKTRCCPPPKKKKKKKKKEGDRKKIQYIS